MQLVRLFYFVVISFTIYACEKNNTKGNNETDPISKNVKPYKDTLFTEYFRRTTDWVAGDGAFSVNLNNGKSLWVFGDSHIGNYDASTKTVPCLFQVRNAAFSLAAVVMVISLINFIFTQKKLGPIGLQPTVLQADGSTTTHPKWKEYLVYIGTLLLVPVIVKMVSQTEYTDYFMWAIGPITLIYLFYEMTKVTSAERKKLFAALVFILFSILFWGIYEQSGGSLSIFAAKNLNNEVLGMKLDPNGVNNSGGSFFIIFIAPVLGLLWIWLNKRKIEPNTVVKFGLGFLFLGLGYYFLFGTRWFATAAGVTSLNFFTLSLLIITLGELCLSPIGLSIMTKLSTKNLQGMMMGMWFLASAYGQYVAGQIGAGMAEVKEGGTNYNALLTYTEGYKQLAVYAVIAGVVLIALSPLMKKLMQEVK